MRIKINYVKILNILWWISEFKPLIAFEWLADRLEDYFLDKGYITIRGLPLDRHNNDWLLEEDD